MESSLSAPKGEGLGRTRADGGLPESVAEGDRGRYPLQETQLLGAYYGLGSAVHAQLAIDVARVLFDGVERDDQGLGDFAVGASLAEQMQDFLLTRGKRLDEGGGARGCKRGGSFHFPFSQRLQEFAHILRRDAPSDGLPQQACMGAAPSTKTRT